MQISVFGTGYVGLVTGICFAEMGTDVIAADIDPSKIKTLQAGGSPIYEPGLEDLLQENIKAKRIQFTTDLKMAIKQSEVLFIAVGTPSAEDGSADLSYVMSVAKTIGETMTDYKVIVNKSTVPVGTQKKVTELIRAQLKERGLNIDFDVVSNPEFLREGTAIEDCLKPARVIVGTSSPVAEKIIRALYEPFLKNGNPILFMQPESSEMTKYAANAMLATKISLMNEFSRVCEKLGADIEMVRKGIGSDPRIGPHFIYAGVGYGGSCFPKDVKALVFAGNQCGEKMEILEAVENVNQTQRERFFAKIAASLGGVQNLKGKRIAQWGVAFKPGTDDIREAPAIYLIEQFLKAGALVVAFDPVAQDNTLRYFKHHPALSFASEQYQAIEGADVLVISTEWKSFKQINSDKVRSLMKTAQVFDGRNLYSVEAMAETKIPYTSIGR